VYLAVLLLGTAVFLGLLYNSLIFISFNPSLARSRDFAIHLGNYLLIILLALIVNICLKVVGALLINALLILPAAAALNLARNLRSFFWLTNAISLAAGLGGFLLSYGWHPVIGGYLIDLGSGGLIVMVGVVIFFVSMALSRWVRGARPAYRSNF
jgi:zinc transport system permease protein